MATAHKPPERDPKDAAEARRWAAEMRRRGEAGEFTYDIPYAKRKLAEERQKRDGR